MGSQAEDGTLFAKLKMSAQDTHQLKLEHSSYSFFFTVFIF